MKDFEMMNEHELNLELERLNALLEDTEEERSFILGQSGNHVSGGLVQRFEEETYAIKKDIDKVCKLIEEKRR